MKKLIRALCLVLMLTLLCGSASAVSLKKGSKGAEVVYLLYRLGKLGYEGLEPQKYTYDSATVEAVRKFQQSRGLKVTGKVNNETWEELFREPYELGRSTGGLGSRSYYVRAGLVPPFTEVVVEDNPNGHDYKAVMTAENFSCTVQLGTDGGKSVDQFVDAVQENLRKTFDEKFAAELGGKNYRISGDKKLKINGKPARICTVTWSFVNPDKANRYSFFGSMELDRVDGTQMVATAEMHYNIPPSASSLTKVLGADTIKQILSSFYCSRDRLADYQSGEAKRKKASGLKSKIKLPAFQPVDDAEQSTLDIVYEIRDHVDPAADGSSGEMDGNTLVSLYYGTKIMQHYVYLVEAGNKPGDALFESVMSLGNGIFDSSLSAAFPEVREKLHAALSAAKLALKKENAPYLKWLGLDTPRWTEAELDTMTERLVGSLDTIIERRKQQNR